jgi:hypothetical protein
LLSFYIEIRQGKDGFDLIQIVKTYGNVVLCYKKDTGVRQIVPKTEPFSFLLLLLLLAAEN